MLLGRNVLALAGKLLQCPDDTETGIARLDDIVYVALFRCTVRIVEEVFIFLFLGCADGSLELTLVKPDGKREMDASAWASGLRGQGITWTEA